MSSTGGALGKDDGTGLGGGADAFTSTVHGNIGPSTATSANTGFQVFLDAGNGGDQTTLTMLGDVGNRGTLGYSVHGGTADTGYDRLRLDADADVDVAASGLIWSNLSGGAGFDDLYLDYRGELDGLLSFNLEGNAGNDWIFANVTLDAGSRGDLGSPTGRAIVNGGDDNDTRLRFVVVNNGDAGFVEVRADLYGGNGDGDVFTYSPLWVNTPDMTADESKFATKVG